MSVTVALVYAPHRALVVCLKHEYCAVGQTNACSVVFQGKQRVAEFEITSRSPSSPATSSGEVQPVMTYDLVNTLYNLDIYFYIFRFHTGILYSPLFLQQWI